MAGDVGGFVAGEKNDRRRRRRAATPSRPSGMRVFNSSFTLSRQDVGHRRFDEAGSDGIHGDVARSDFHGDGFGEADESGFGRDIVGLAGVAHLGDHGLPTLMMRPARARIMVLSACWMQRCAPVRLVLE